MKNSADPGRYIRKVKMDGQENISALKNKAKKPVIGYLCCFAPPELISAAGAIPYRISGKAGDDNSAADAYLEPYGCSYVRNIMARAAKGEYKGLDGLVISHSCDMVQRLYGIWTYYHPFPYSYLFNVPHQTTPWARRFFKRELHFFRESLEEFTGCRVSDDRLKEEIYLYNTNRQLVRDIYQIRSDDPDRAKGSEILEILLAGGNLPADSFKKLLNEKKVLFAGRSTARTKKKRILVWGSLIDDPVLFKMIENSGGSVVADDTCIGFRTWENDLPITADPYEGLTDHYFINFLCPRTDRGPGLQKYDYLLERIKKYQVDGVVGYCISFCDPHKFDYPDLRDLLKEKEIPMLLIDDNYSFEPAEAIQTRLQAFLEMI
jgi:bcr-type benzoyl-CoA reductase subunit C